MPKRSRKNSDGENSGGGENSGDNSNATVMSRPSKKRVDGSNSNRNRQQRLEAEEEAQRYQEYMDGLEQRRPLNSNSNSVASGNMNANANSIPLEDMYTRVEELSAAVDEIDLKDKSVPDNQWARRDPAYNAELLKQITNVRAYARTLVSNCTPINELLGNLQAIEDKIKRVGGGRRKTRRRSQRSRKNKSKSRRR